jgi:PIN domain nuclease of toxin-antitoxin system
MLIAQARCEDLILLTTDTWVRSYDVRMLDASK